jgi:SAM-dependent methyltransferase
VTYALRLSRDELARYRFMAERAREREADLWRLAGLTAGARVADIGCGPGAVLRVLADVVGPTGALVGVDADATAVAAAREALVDVPRAEVRVGRADATGLPEASVDVVVVRHVLAHNGGREQEIVDHLASLVRPGGSVYLVDAEHRALRARPPVDDLDDLGQRYLSFQTARGNDLSVGLRLGELVTGAGLELVEHRGWYEIFAAAPGFRVPSWAARDAMVEAGFATQDDIDRWAAALEQSDEAPEPRTLFLPLFSATGRRIA